MAIAIISVILIILVLLLFAPIKVRLQYENGEFKLNAFLYGVKVYTLKKGETDTSNSPEKKAEKFEKDTNKLSLRLSDILDLYKKVVQLLKKFVSVASIKIKIRVGTGDAATTAISTGALWAAVYNLIGIIGRIMYINNHKVEITPDYSAATFNAGGECIFKSRAVYIIIIGILILFKIKSLKGKEE